MNLDRLLEDVEGFDWDKGNVKKNWLRHKVKAKESEEVFFNKPLLMSFDKKHSKKERRLQALGKTDQGRLLFLAFAVRKDKVRIISARNQNKKERRKYTAQ